jgi:type II restriction enzyme
MKLGFEESQSAYSSGSQSARSWTEAWVKAQAYCPHCGNAKMAQFPNNSPVADFLCSTCNEEFELKSQKGSSAQRLLMAPTRRNVSALLQATTQTCC